MSTDPTSTDPTDSETMSTEQMSTEQMSTEQMSTEQMSTEPTTAAPPLTPNSSWLWDHIGRLTGLVLGGCAFGFLVFLALIGSKPALGLVVVLAAGFAMIAVGGVMRGEMRSH